MSRDLESRLENALRPKYQYMAVTTHGHGVHSGPMTLRKAQQAVEQLRAGNWPDAEVERVLVLDGGGRQYWLKRGGRWVPEHLAGPQSICVTKIVPDSP